MGRKRNVYWDDSENRVHAVRDLVKSVGKPIRKITKRDFLEHKLGSLLNYYKGSPKRALIEAGYDPGPVKHPKGYWDVRENRVLAVLAVMEKTGKDSTDLRKMDFIKTGYSLLVKNRSIKELLMEAGLNFKRYQREPGYWKDKDNRVLEVKMLVDALEKDPSDVTKKDFSDHGLSTILNIYRGSLRAIMNEAGFDVVKKKPPKYWNEKENRVKATKMLVNKLDKNPEEIKREDFVEEGLQSLLLKYRDELAAEYEKGEIITYNKGYLLNYKTTVQRALVEAGLMA